MHLLFLNTELTFSEALLRKNFGDQVSWINYQPKTCESGRINLSFIAVHGAPLTTRTKSFAILLNLFFSVSFEQKGTPQLIQSWERALGRMDAIQGCYWNQGSTGPGQCEHGCGLVLRVFYFFSCLVKLSPFEPPVPSSSWPRWKGNKLNLTSYFLLCQIRPLVITAYVLCVSGRVTQAGKDSLKHQVPWSLWKEVLMVTQQGIKFTHVTFISPIQRATQ